MFDYRISKHPHFNEACRTFALRHNMAKLAERAGMNVQTLRNKLNPEQPHQLTAPDIWLLTDLTEDSTLVDGFLAQIHCLPCVPTNEVAREKMPQYVLKATSEIGRVAACAVYGVQMNATAGCTPLYGGADLMKVRAYQGDTVDALCWRHYGRTQGVTEQVLQSNPGLAEHGPFLPHGLQVELPDIATTTTVQTVQLWD